MKISINQHEKELLSIKEKASDILDLKKGIEKKIRELEEESSSNELKKTDTEELIRSIEEEIEALIDTLEEKKTFLVDTNEVFIEVKAEETRIAANVSEQQKLVGKHSIMFDSIKEEFTKIKLLLDKTEEEFRKVSQEHRSTRKDGPLPISIPLQQPSEEIQSLCVLGDVHGWAPGLFNWWEKENIHTVSISGNKLNENIKMMNEIFPDPISRTLAGLSLPRIGIDGNPIRSEDIVTPYFNLHLIEGKANNLCILLGDLIDRGDHNELVLEAVRQSILIKPGRSFFLIGNHEQMVIENDFDRWCSNEKNYQYEQGKQHAGTFLHEPILTATETLEESMRLNFSILRGALGALLLCQHISLISILEGDGLDRYSETISTLNKIGLKKKAIHKAVTKGGWNLHKIGAKFLDGISSNKMGSEFIIPGAINSALFRGTLCIHAEPSCIPNIRENLLNDLESTKTPAGISFGFARMESGESADKTLLWERGWWKECNNPVRPTSNHVISSEITRIAHGHTAGDGVRIAMSVDNVEIVAADESITPWQRYNLHPEDAMDPSRCPDGFRVEK